MKIIFLGTPEFAVPSLKILVENGYDVVAVVTAPDKPAGRGQKLMESEVKQYAKSKGLKILQPIKLADSGFLEEIRLLKADLQIVVAFRMMPEKLWSMPKYGTLNLHGSLLPNYRGAAPINRAIMNGEKVTGVTTFFLKQEIDTGDIIYQEEISIGNDEAAGELRDRMMVVGSALVLKTVKAIESHTIQTKSQDLIMKSNIELKNAPKIFKVDSKLNFSNKIQVLFNQIRGLSPYPGSFFEMKLSDGTIQSVKVFKSKMEPAGTVLTHELISDSKSFLKMSAADGFIHFLEIQIPGKKRMKVEDLLRGYSFPKDAEIL